MVIRLMLLFKITIAKFIGKGQYIIVQVLDESIMVTIKEIASRLNISSTTVSNVIHGNTKEVSEQTIKRVQKMIRDLNYIPNMSARTLAQNSSKIIGLIMRYPAMEGKNAMQDPFNSELIGMIESEVRKAGYFLMLYSTDKVDEIMNMAVTWNVDGLIALGLGAKECKKLKETSGKNIVFIDCYFEEDDGAYVNVGLKDRQYAKQMTEFLISQGHKRIAFLADNCIGVDYERWLGYCEALKIHNLPRMDNFFIKIKYGLRGIEESYNEIYYRRQEFTALFFASDYYAALAINFFYDRGLSVPNDMSIVGFDDNIFGRNTRPRLTTVRQNASEKGRLAVAQMLKLINKEPLLINNIRLDAELKIRETVKGI